MLFPIRVFLFGSSLGRGSVGAPWTISIQEYRMPEAHRRYRVTVLDRIQHGGIGG
jgi:hypothetical protein